MIRRSLLTLLLCLPLVSCQTSTATLSNDIATLGNTIFGNVNLDSAAASQFTPAELTQAFKEALTIGTGEVVGQLGVKNGFNLDPNVRIPLPGQLQDVQSALDKVGMSFLLDDLELRLNRAAEIATPAAKEIFVNAITQMSFSDVYDIYKGPQDSATQYFKKTTTNPIKDRFSPIINQALADAGVVRAYDNVMAQYQAIPFVPDVKADLTDYAMDKAIDGMFFYLAEQEAAIRQDPARQTTELLKRVFGGLKS